jgi:cell division protein FtsW (lipid II flippase)
MRRVIFNKSRNLEALLLLVALGVGAFAHYLVQVNTGGVFSFSSNWYLVIVAGVLLLHVVIRVNAPAADPFIYPTALLLNLLGIVMIHRLDAAELIRFKDTPMSSLEAPSQVTWLLVGISAVAVGLFVVRDHRQLQRYTFTFMVFGFSLLLLPLLPGIGATINGARLWVRIAGFSFQPAEFAKIALAIFFAGYLARTRLSIQSIKAKFLGIGFPRPQDLGPILIAWSISILILVSQRDLGTSLLFFGLFVGILYVATGQRTWLVLGALLFSLGALVAHTLFSHVRLRATVWLNPFDYANAEGYQILQGLYGFASGGLFGRGLGEGFSWLVPYAESDFILAAFGEELGYTGMVAITMLYVILVERAIRIALSGRDDFGTLLSVGLGLIMALQLFVVFGGVTRLIPLTGLTAPFLAAGGSALISNWIMVGLLLKISHTTNLLNAPAGDA